MAMNIREAERAVIAALLGDNECKEQVLGECRAEMFTDPDCRRIYQIAQQLSAEEMKVDLTTVFARTEQAFGPQLVEVSRAFYIPSNLPDYITQIKEAWQFRHTSASLRECLDKAQKHDPDCYTDIDRLQESLLGAGHEEEASAAALCPGVLDTIGEKEKGITTGFVSLDTMLGGGLLAGRLMVLGGRPGMGKSALALNMALHAAVSGAVVLYVTLEMTARELMRRALYMLSGVSEQAVLSKGEQAMEKIRAAGETLMKQHFYIRDRGDSSLTSLMSACRRVHAAEGRLDLLVIDYVGLMRTERTKTSTRQQEIAEISRGLKRLAVRMPTCVLLLSQLNREADNRTDHVPRLSDLRESGDLEQDADTVLFPVRLFAVDETVREDREAKLYVAKNRSGSPGRVDLAWNGPTYTFREA